MPKVKVRHGLISYLTKDKNTDQEYEARAFRGMTVDISQKEYDRLKPLGAVIDADEDLAQPGRLMALPDGASNEEVLNWAMAATPSEIEALAASRPQLAARLRDAHDEARRRVRQYNEHLGGVIDRMESAAEDAADARKRAAERAGAPQQVTPGSLADQQRQAAQQGDGNDGKTGGVSPVTGGNPAPPIANADGTITEDVAAFDEVVQGSNRDVEKYLGEHPEHAQHILAAETRRAEAAQAAGDNDARVRSGVVKAVEVAAQHA